MHGRFVTLGAIAALFLLTTTSTLASVAPSHYATNFAPASKVLDGPVASGSWVCPAFACGEPSVLVDRANGYVLIGDVSDIHRTTNGGSTWSSIPAPSIGNSGLLDDGTALAQDAAGVVYAGQTTGTDFTISRSTDGGKTFTLATVVPGVPTADRPWLAARNAGQVAFIGNMGARTDCFYSTDGATTWSSVTTSPLHTIAGNVVFDAAGRLYMAVGDVAFMWTTPCFGSPGSADTSVVGGASGSRIQTQIAVEGSNPLGANVYLAVPSAVNAAMQIRAMHGMNAPSEKTVTVSDATMKSNTYGAIAANPATGDIAIAWYESTTPGDPSLTSYPTSASWDVVVARVSGYWTATPTVTRTVVDTGAHVGQICMSGTACSTGSQDRDLLDYMGVTFGPDGAIHATWGHDGNTSITKILYAKVP